MRCETKAEQKHYPPCFFYESHSLGEGSRPVNMEDYILETREKGRRMARFSRAVNSLKGIKCDRLEPDKHY